MVHSPSNALPLNSTRCSASSQTQRISPFLGPPCTPTISSPDLKPESLVDQNGASAQWYEPVTGSSLTPSRGPNTRVTMCGREPVLVWAVKPTSGCFWILFHGRAVSSTGQVYYQHRARLTRCSTLTCQSPSCSLADSSNSTTRYFSSAKIPLIFGDDPTMDRLIASSYSAYSLPVIS
jgi:hypothetical protein